MNHGKEDTQRASAGKRQRQEDAPSQTEQQARQEGRQDDGFTQPPARDSSKQPRPATEPSTITPKDAQERGEVEREEIAFPPARKSDRGSRQHDTDVPGQDGYPRD